MLIGNLPTRIDDKGRLKIPSRFRRFIDDSYGRELFVTSLTGKSVRIYPFPLWLETEKRVAEIPTMNPIVYKFLKAVSYFGQVTSMDGQGRVLISNHLRKSAEITGEVAVLGHQRFLEVWNGKNFLESLENNPITDQDLFGLSNLGI